MCFDLTVLITVSLLNTSFYNKNESIDPFPIYLRYLTNDRKRGRDREKGRDRENREG